MSLIEDVLLEEMAEAIARADAAENEIRAGREEIVRLRDAIAAGALKDISSSESSDAAAKRIEALEAEVDAHKEAFYAERGMRMTAEGRAAALEQQLAQQPEPVAVVEAEPDPVPAFECIVTQRDEFGGIKKFTLTPERLN